MPSHLLFSLYFSFCPPGTPFSLWCTLSHCDEEWKFKGTPSLTLLQRSLGRIPYWVGVGVGDTATQLRELPEKNSN